MKDHKLMIRLETDLFQRLQEEAKTCGLSVAALIRHTMIHHLKEVRQ